MDPSATTSASAREIGVKAASLNMIHVLKVNSYDEALNYEYEWIDLPIVLAKFWMLRVGILSIF